jgi:hypothetical protein
MKGCRLHPNIPISTKLFMEQLFSYGTLQSRNSDAGFNKLLRNRRPTGYKLKDLQIEENLEWKIIL